MLEKSFYRSSLVWSFLINTFILSQFLLLLLALTLSKDFDIKNGILLAIIVLAGGFAIWYLLRCFLIALFYFRWPEPSIILSGSISSGSHLKGKVLIKSNRLLQSCKRKVHIRHQKKNRRQVSWDTQYQGKATGPAIEADFDLVLEDSLFKTVGLGEFRRQIRLTYLWWVFLVLHLAINID